MSLFRFLTANTTINTIIYFTVCIYLDWNGSKQNKPICHSSGSKQMPRCSKRYRTISSFRRYGGFPGNAYTFYREDISIICFKMKTKPRMWKRTTKIKTPKPTNTNKNTRQNHKTVWLSAVMKCLPKKKKDFMHKLNNLEKYPNIWIYALTKPKACV